MVENVAKFARPVNDDSEENEEAGQVKDVGGVAGKRLLAFIDRIERLEGEKAELSDDIKDVYAEAKGVGFEPKIIRKLISMRKKEVEKRREEEELLELYKAAIGME